MKVRTGIGKDSHRFLPDDSVEHCIIAGLIFDDVPGFKASSDGDVVFHALCNAITSLTHVPILGGIAEDLCLKDGITDSQVYLEVARNSLGKQKISHVAISIEGKRPTFKPRLEEMRQNIARVLNIEVDQVGLTASSGEGLTDVGCGEGLECLAIVTTIESH